LLLENIENHVGRKNTLKIEGTGKEKSALRKTVKTECF